VRPRPEINHIAGKDLYETDLPTFQAMIEILVKRQRAWLGRAEGLSGLGLPDWRGGCSRRCSSKIGSVFFLYS
jgi:hypothetical protein